MERHGELRPGTFRCDSNRLTQANLCDRLAAAIKTDLLEQVRDSLGHPLPVSGRNTIRLIEKTPKNILRIPFIDALFPDSLFVYLYRNPRENISSIMDGWRSSRFVTYRWIRGRHGPWSFLLPPLWQSVVAKPLADVAAFQWESANRYAVEDLSRLRPERWTTVAYEDLIAQPLTTVRRLCNFMGVVVDDALLARCSGPLPLSRYTLTSPSEQKSEQNAAELAPVVPQMEPLAKRLECLHMSKHSI